MQKWIIIRDMRFFSQEEGREYEYDILKAGTVVSQIADNSLDYGDRMDLRKARNKAKGKRVIFCDWKGIKRYCTVGTDVKPVSRNTNVPKPRRQT